MSKLVIRKRVTLEFLGDEYENAYLDFKSIPVGDYDQLIDEIKAAGEDDNKKANAVILKILKQYYLGGKFPNESGELEDLDSSEELDSLDRDSLLACFSKMTGQEFAKGAVDIVDPKSDTPSKNG